MLKNKMLCNIEIDNLTFEKLIFLFCKGNGIVFVTESGRLVGGITSGDIYRKMKLGYIGQASDLINKKIRSLVY